MATPLVIGWQATVSGLVNFPQLNGATVRLLANNGDRWRVRLGDDTYNIRPANLTGVDPEPEARELLRDAGRPQTEAYVQWQIRRMAVMLLHAMMEAAPWEVALPKDHWHRS